MCDTKWQLISYFALYVCKSAFRLWPTWILRKAVRVLIYTVKGGPPSCPKCIVVTDVKPRWEKSCKVWILSYDEHCTHMHLLTLWSVIYTCIQLELIVLVEWMCVLLLVINIFICLLTMAKSYDLVGHPSNWINGYKKVQRLLIQLMGQHMKIYQHSITTILLKQSF